LLVGIVYSDNGKANSALGVGTANSLDAAKAVRAFVNGINKGGGLAGRRIQALYHAIDATSSDYSTEASAACASFTQDAHVAVVLDYALPIRYGMGSCLSKAGIPELALIGADEAQTKALPLFASPGNMTTDRRYRGVLHGQRHEVRGERESDRGSARGLPEPEGRLRSKRQTGHERFEAAAGQHPDHRLHDRVLLGRTRGIGNPVGRARVPLCRCGPGAHGERLRAGRSRAVRAAG
jgi:hypothetical protein